MRSNEGVCKSRAPNASIQELARRRPPRQFELEPLDIAQRLRRSRKMIAVHQRHGMSHGFHGCPRSITDHEQQGQAQHEIAVDTRHAGSAACLASGGLAFCVTARVDTTGQTVSVSSDARRCAVSVVFTQWAPLEVEWELLNTEPAREAHNDHTGRGNRKRVGGQRSWNRDRADRGFTRFDQGASASDPSR